MGNKQAKTKLTEEDIQMLIANTDFTREKILEWFDEFKEECQDGVIDKKLFIKFYRELLPNKGYPDDFSSYVFKAFDQDDSGTIDFNEFLIAFSITSKGRLEDRLNWAFNYYDLDNNNYIDSKELRKVLNAIYKMLGVDSKGDATAETKANQVFQDLDSNHDRKISRQEFIEGCLKDEFLCHLLGPNI